ncbi:MAG TPA: bifunctional serine/threonine-protein kinase/formylglycine-generating enzyme family protein [Planctomycetota bacterium]|nr:bifunctional serine/threonine-protein kinase/formylglycine-generating enzyme family protein [Planctomycetota bacterium]
MPAAVAAGESSDLPARITCTHCGIEFSPFARKSEPDSPTLELLSPTAAAAELKKHKKAPSERRSIRNTPSKIGAYEILSEINRGGMGIVYKAVDPQLRRHVAIKVLLAGEGAKDEDIKRFQREAQATARLLHPNIVPIYAVGEHDQMPYLVMDFVEGKTAKQLKEEGLMTPRLALSIIEGVAEALHHAHLQGVIHRDVKPANIMLDKSGRAQLMDFGLARRVDEDLEVTQSGTTMGTPSYMAPEQAEGKLDEVDGQSDVYSAGACLYELLTGKPPFEANTIMATLRKVLEDNPIPPRRLNPKIHRDVETICLKCLEKEKRNRYASGKQLADDIRRFNAGEAIMAKPLGFFAARFRAARQHWEISLALLIMVVSSVAALAYSYHEARSTAERQVIERRTALDNSLRKAQGLLENAKDGLSKLSGSPVEFEKNASQARALISEASMAFKHMESLAPESPEPRAALETLKKLDTEVEVRRFIYKARAFLYPAQARPEDPPVSPNYAGAEFAAQEALDRDPQNAEARKLLRLATGIRAVQIDVAGDAANVFAKRIQDGFGRTLVNEASKDLGPTPVRGKELEPGFYIISFQRQGQGVQQATLSVGRESKEEDLELRISINSPDENMVRIAEGSVPIPQQGVVKVPAFSIDRFEYPNKAGAIPMTGIATLMDAGEVCAQQGKRVCTSAQWLRACMGDDERRYPYGKVYSRTCATGMDADVQKRAAMSGQFSKCRTPEGIYDMSGNVAEWTDGSGTQEEIVFGGDWTSPARYADLTVSCRARSLPEEVAKDHLGFRCCKNR